MLGDRSETPAFKEAPPPFKETPPHSIETPPPFNEAPPPACGLGFTHASVPPHLEEIHLPFGTNMSDIWRLW